MILRVLDANNNVLHDCKELGCSVSWDGYALRDLSPEELHADEKTRPADLQAVAIGKQVPGAEQANETIFSVTGRTAKLRRQD